MNNPYQLKHSDFTKEIDVVCPNCMAKAIVKGGDLYQVDENERIFCVCVACGYNQKYMERKSDFFFKNSKGQVLGYKVKLLGGEVDPYFHHPLWYKVDVKEGMIWAYNLPHLEVIESFIASKNRGRNGLENKNKSIAARLPKWMSSAKNREILLKYIHQLKSK